MTKDKFNKKRLELYEKHLDDLKNNKEYARLLEFKEENKSLKKEVRKLKGENKKLKKNAKGGTS